MVRGEDSMAGLGLSNEEKCLRSAPLSLSDASDLFGLSRTTLSHLTKPSKAVLEKPVDTSFQPKDLVAQCRAYTRTEVEDFYPRLVEDCLEAGIVLICTPALEHSGVWGGVVYLQNAPLPHLLICGVSDTNDHFWPSFLELLAFLVAHPSESGILKNDQPIDPACEERAKAWLIAPAAWENFLLFKRFTAERIRVFAYQQGVDPGIVAGRLEREGRLSAKRARDYKKRYRIAKYLAR